MSTEEYAGPFDSTSACSSDADCSFGTQGGFGTCYLDVKRCYCPQQSMLDGPSCDDATKASRNKLIFASVVSLYALYLIATRFNITLRILKLKGGWVWNASGWATLWSWGLVATVLCHVVASVFASTLGDPKSLLATALLNYARLIFLLLAVLTVTGAFIESATAMRSLRGLDRAKNPVRLFAVASFALLASFILTDRFALATYAGFAIVLVLIIFAIVAPLLLYLRFAMAKSPAMKPRSAAATSHNKRKTNVHLRVEASSSAEDDTVGCTTVMIDLVRRLWNGDDARVVDGMEDDNDSQQASLPSSNHAAAAPPTPTKTVDTTEVSKVIARRASAQEPSETFDVEPTVVLRRTQPSSPRKSRRRPQRRAASTRDLTKLSSDRVLAFLRRVLGLSVRLVFWLTVFLAAALVALATAWRYSPEPINAAMIVEFVQSVAMLGCSHSLLWFLDFTSIKRLKAQQKKVKAMTDLNLDEDPATNEVVSKQVPASTSTATLSKKGSKESLRKKASYFVDVEEANKTGGVAPLSPYANTSRSSSWIRLKSANERIAQLDETLTELEVEHVEEEGDDEMV